MLVRAAYVNIGGFLVLVYECVLVRVEKLSQDKLIRLGLSLSLHIFNHSGPTTPQTLVRDHPYEYS